MAFTAGELTNIANAALDFYYNKGDTFKQSIQAKPLLRLMESSAKSFPGGKGNISLAVKGDYGAGGVNDHVVGYTHNDTVNFYTPANIKRCNYPWREHHMGLTLTHTELKIDGISVTDDSGDGSSLSNHSDRDVTVLVNLLQDKLEDFGEQYARSMNNLMWGDGTGDAKALAGLQSIIVDVPNAGNLGGLARSTNTWWQNRSACPAFGTAGGRGAVTSATTNGGALLQFLQQEYRQLIRYGGRPSKFLAGSSFISAMEVELRANGNYSMTGFATGKDVSVGKISYMGTDFEYDPSLDALGKAKRCYWYDSRDIYLVAMQDEWRHQHSPDRTPDKYVLYRSLTSTGQLCARRLNSAAVIDIA
jgi:hypothetical protein